jgi:hypothetical protein
MIVLQSKEAYSDFKNSHPVVKEGFFKFASFHPNNCIMAGANGVQRVT